MATKQPGGGGGLGTKSDMISSKFDEVQRNQIWREHIGKEYRTQTLCETFHVNPNTLTPLPLKPGEMDPSKPGKYTQSRGGEGGELPEGLKRSQMAPREKSDFPMTEAQELGWDASEAKLNKRWYYTRESSEVTKYASAYVAMAGISPYADKRGGSK